MRSLNRDLKNKQVSRGSWKVGRTFQTEEHYMWKQRGMKQYDVSSELFAIFLVQELQIKGVRWLLKVTDETAVPQEGNKSRKQ